MKFLHTADWHLGKLLEASSRLEDQRFVLEQIVQTIITEKPDAVLLAGDIYDRAVPPAQAVELFDEFMHRIVIELKTPVLAIAGNHDSAERIDCYSGLLRRQGLYISGILGFPLEPIQLGGLEFFLLPFATPEMVRSITGIDKISTHEDVFRYAVDHIQTMRTPNKHAVLIAHCFASGASNEGDKERDISVGGVETVSADIFAPFAYTALGHLHRPQSLLAGRVRYAGSPVPYSFSEIGYEKTLSFVQINDDGSLEHRAIPLQQKRNLRLVQGRIDITDGEKRFVLAEETLEMPTAHDFLKVELTNDTLVLEPMQTIRRDFPNALELYYRKLQTTRSEKFNQSGAGISSEQLSTFTPEQLLFDFYRTMTGETPSEGSSMLMKQILNQAENRMSGISEIIAKSAKKSEANA